MMMMVSFTCHMTFDLYNVFFLFPFSLFAAPSAASYIAPPRPPLPADSLAGPLGPSGRSSPAFTGSYAPPRPPLPDDDDEDRFPLLQPDQPIMVCFIFLLSFFSLSFSVFFFLFPPPSIISLTSMLLYVFVTIFSFFLSLSLCVYFFLFYFFTVSR